ncbi:methyltransferase domain-containing protein [Patescibacteria group bacterium]|nr:methyltransferase domain-containing protein [Patescibacteria group bacterium]
MSVTTFLRQSGEAFFHAVLRHYLRDSSSVLDVGSGTDSAIQYVPVPYKEGIDVYRKSVLISKKKKIHHKYMVGDIRKLSSFYTPKSFDAAISIDVIEHLTQKEGIQLIKSMERIAKKTVVLLTPNGFYHQDELEGNPYQVHKSGWKSEDFRKLGFTVYGLRGLQMLRNDHAGIKYKPWIFWGVLSAISEVLFFMFPDVCFDLFAVKKLNNPKTT